MSTPVEGPLNGVVVVDLTRALAGPYCTMLLADMGADVIKVEPPAGDPARQQGPFLADDELHAYGGYFQSVNRNKRSVMVDMRTPEGVDRVRNLIQRADIVVENFKAGVMEEIGLSYETLAAQNPSLVYGCLRGFGDPRTGASPYQDRPAFDVVAQAMGGIMRITGEPDEPTKVGPGVGDIFPAALMAAGLLAGVVEARRTGTGRLVDVAMYDAIVSLCERTAYLYSYTGVTQHGVGSDHPLLCPFGVYRAEKGWVTIAAPHDRHWSAFCHITGRPELASNDRYATNNARVARRDEVRGIVEEWTSQRTPRQIVELLGTDVPCGAVHDAADIAADPHIAARRMLPQVEHPRLAQPSRDCRLPDQVHRRYAHPVPTRSAARRAHDRSLRRTGQRQRQPARQPPRRPPRRHRRRHPGRQGLGCAAATASSTARRASRRPSRREP